MLVLPHFQSLQATDPVLYPALLPAKLDSLSAWLLSVTSSPYRSPPFSVVDGAGPSHMVKWVTVWVLDEQLLVDESFPKKKYSFTHNLYTTDRYYFIKSMVCLWHKWLEIISIAT